MLMRMRDKGERFIERKDRDSGVGDDNRKYIFMCVCIYLYKGLNMGKGSP